MYWIAKSGRFWNIGRKGKSEYKTALWAGQGAFLIAEGEDVPRQSFAAGIGCGRCGAEVAFVVLVRRQR